MKTARIIMATLAWIITAMLMIPRGLPAQDSGALEQTEKFSKEELSQMLAPIALYPDSLIAQILMASTYPIEVVEAERWLHQNKGLKGDSLDNALQLKPWDPSVKSLCHFPDILFAMSDKLDQTRKLGDAFLVQEDEVMYVIQELRGKARDQGNLKTTAEQQVIVEREIVRIEPVDSRVIYVPVYDPLSVYGPWWYPAYPPYYWYYPPGYIITGGYISYGPPIFIGIGFWSWTWFDWHVHHIYIDDHKTKRFHRHRDRRDSGTVFWRHDPRHRRGVAYRDRRTSERFGAKPKASGISPASQEIRGYPPKSYRKKASEPPRRPVEVRKGTPAPIVRTEPKRIQQTPMRDTPFRGIDNGNFERRAGERGGESRRSMETIRPGSRVRQQDDGFRDSGRGGVFRR
ncbi:MAG: DUF3300 domain-containing protein [Thermodesulfovibrionales bacterium]|nr:DUF3300 domain-containing protein [Thermodesulfovibrionales bacterium]